ncbi:unnamed protein product [Penicillium camemberti]|uniref:Nephrocystin 3-like N-terminal domain-containing protein n=2 Tax=Penicillium TaxID=5073 RepID=A0A9W4J5G0_9EURO|nr:unnamed protein product [Penicillium salamii]CRL27571.1 unnamed protein product [Penicillium camemberti]
MDGVSGVASIIAVAQFAASIVEYIKAIVDAPLHKRKLLVAIIQARGLLLTLHELTIQVEDEDWSSTILSLSQSDGPLSTFQTTLEDIAEKLGITNSDSRMTTALHRLRWPFDQKGLEERITLLEKLKSQFSLALANDHLRLSMEIRNELRYVQTQLTESTINSRRQMINSLSREQEIIVKSLSAANISKKLDAETVVGLRASTEWFLSHEKFKEWHTTNPIQQVLVLTGVPGSGKSYLCEVVRFFVGLWHQLDSVCIASFPFHPSGQEEPSESLVLSSIVQQVLLQRPYLIEHVNALRVTGGPLSVADSVKLIMLARGDLDQLYIILDEFDICERIALRTFEILLSVKPPLNILIAGRPTILLSEALQGYPLVSIEDARPSKIIHEIVDAMIQGHLGNH